MSDLTSAAATFACVALILATTHIPLGTYIAHVFTTEKHLGVERFCYRIVGVDPESQQHWTTYTTAVLSFSAVSILTLWGLILAQDTLPFADGRHQSIDGALNTAISFVTNTNWQSYSGENGATHLVQMLGLTVQNFLSAAVGLAVAIALIRGLARHDTDRIGNFWVDLTRSIFRILLPLTAIAALLLLAGGVIPNLTEPHTITTITGTQQTLPAGPVASQEAIKLLGTNGGGFFNANSAHPFENPTPTTNLIEIVLILLIPFALPRTYGILVADRRQGHVVLALMATLSTLTWAAALTAELTLATTAQGALAGKELRFGVPGSVLFSAATTGTSTGAVNSMHDSASPLAGGTYMLNMLLGEISPGGVGTGLYSALILVIITVFLAGLMVGRTPELLGKQISRREITCAALFILVMPALVLTGTATAALLPQALTSLTNTGPHGLSEIMYAYTSAANNNGSAFAGLNADTPWYNLTLALTMLIGRFLPIVLVLALAGSLAAQPRRAITAGTMPTHTPLFAGLLLATAIIVAGLTFFPALALGPIAEATL